MPVVECNVRNSMVIKLTCSYEKCDYSYGYLKAK